MMRMRWLTVLGLSAALAISSLGIATTATAAEPVLTDPCPNALARQQTGAALLLDCRAYELVSAANTGGYDVESSLVPGQVPYGAYPDAVDRILYGMHNGGIPGSGSPTNNGVDPYVAERGGSGWETHYVGIPSNVTPTTGPFASTLLDADSALETFAFGGPKLCRPCFPDGSSGIPVRKGEAPLVQGMKGALPVADPEISGEVQKTLSADGSHLVFSSTQIFEDPANDSGSDVTVYSRDLESGVTQVVSTLPNGDTIEAGDGVVALNVSADGSRVLVGRLVSTDARGNRYFDLFLHVGTSPNSIPIADTPSGALYAGMTSDGRQVLFNTPDPLADDTDAGADLFRVTVDGGVDIERVSAGDSAGNTDSCDPAGNSFNPADWNVLPTDPTDCSVVALGGRGGVAQDTGSVYFLSPERLDGSGMEGAPNLFLVRPGEKPEFVATLESSASEPLLPPVHQHERSFGPFTKPVGAAFDPVDGAMYVYDAGSAGGFFGGTGAYVEKFDAAGDPVSSYGSGGKNDGSGSGAAFMSYGSYSGEGLDELFGLFGAPPVGESLPTQIAVDNDPGSPSYRDLYVPTLNQFGFAVQKFNHDGVYESSITVGEAFSFTFPGAVAVDPATGDLYVGVLSPFGTNEVKVFDAGGAFKSSVPLTGYPYGLAVDGAADKFYVALGDKTEIFKVSDGTSLGVLDSDPAKGVALDSSDGHVFVDKGDRVVEYAGGTQVGAPFATAQLSNSVNLAARDGRVLMSNPGENNAVLYGARVTPPSRGYDSPLVIESVRRAEGGIAGEFQTAPSGNYAGFRSTLSLTGEEASNKYDVFRFAANGGALECVSCGGGPPEPSTDAHLSHLGASVLGDGRVFFDSGNPLVLRDTNSVQDVYEWSDGTIELITPGTSQFDSELLSASSDGRDVFFFTRDVLSPEDANGAVMKIYDARAEGGWFHVPDPPQCAASDECHGPGSQAPPKAGIASLAGAEGNVVAKKPRRKCRKGSVRKRGKCVRKPRTRRSAKRHGKVR